MKVLQHAIPMIAASVLLTASMAVATAQPKKPSTANSSKKHTSGKVHKSSHTSARSRANRVASRPSTVDEHVRSNRHSFVSIICRESLRARGTRPHRKPCAVISLDQGWQSKTVPDSRALIRLGLGPNHDHLLNPESAMVGGSFPVQSARAASGNSGTVSLPHSSTTSAPVSTSPDLSSAR